MTKKFEFNWQIPVPESLLNGCIFDRWTEEKDNTDFEPSCLFKVDEYGFFIYWKSEGRVSQLAFVFLPNPIKSLWLPLSVSQFNNAPSMCTGRGCH